MPAGKRPIGTEIPTQIPMPALLSQVKLTVPSLDSSNKKTTHPIVGSVVGTESIFIF